jgi:hypothetical protein
MDLRRRIMARKATVSAMCGLLLAGALVAVLPEVAAANVVLPPDPSWVTNVSQGNNRDDGFKVKAMAKMGNVLYIGGGFTQIAPDNKAFHPAGTAGTTGNQSGIDQPYLFAVDAITGAAISSFRPRLNAPVEALEVNPATNTVYAGGAFTSANGAPLNGLAILNGTTGALQPGVTQRSFVNSGQPGTVWGLRLLAGRLYVGGNFSSVPGCGLADCSRGQLASFVVTNNATALSAFRAFLQGGKVQALDYDPATPQYLYVGGQFTGARTVAGGAIVPSSGYLVAYDVTSASGTLMQNWTPAPQPPPPGPGGVVRDPEVRDLAARNGNVYAAIGGGGGRFYVFQGVTTGDGIRRQINTDGDVQTVAVTPQGDRVFVGGHFTRLATPSSQIPVPPNDKCQMFSVDTSQFNVQSLPYLSNGGHYGPFAVVADDVGNTWWGGQLTTLAQGWISPEDTDPNTPPVFGPASCGTGDQRNKIGQTSAGVVGGIAHLRSSPGFSDTTPPATPPGSVGLSNGIFQAINVSWSPASDNRGISAYYVRGTGPGLTADQVVGTQWGNETFLALSPGKLQQNANYTFRVCAIDLGDNERCSAPAGPIRAGSGPPSLPGNLRDFGQFKSVVPNRILDTRSGVGRPGTTPVPGGQIVSVDVTGGTSGVHSSAGAVVLNVTVVGPSAAGFMTVFPNGEPLPNASNLNFNAGQTVANLVVARVGTNDRVNFRLNTGSAHVLMDVVGYYGSGAQGQPAGSRITTVTPVRRLDSRTGLGMPGGTARTIGPGQTIEVPVAGSGVNGVVLNLTAVGPTTGTFVTVYPADEPARPTTSNLNLARGQVRANLVMVKVPTGGPSARRIKLYNATGNVHLLVDVVAEYRQGSNGDPAAGRILPLDAPMRVVDTRVSGGNLVGPGSRLHDFSVIEEATNPSVAGMVLNATALGASASTFLTLFPGGEARPVASNINVVPGQVTPNLAVTRMSAGDDLSIWNQSGSVAYIFDVTALVLG